MEPKLYKPEKHNVAGWYMSENLSGIHCFWDGGISRGILLKNIPWIQSTKFMRGDIISTGLWSDELDSIPVQDYWLNMLPSIPLDGIIYKSDLLYFAITGSPNFREIFKTGPVIGSTCSVFSSRKILKWIKQKQREKLPHLMWVDDEMTFEEELHFLDKILDSYGSNTYLLCQRKLPLENAQQALEIELRKSTRGLILRDPTSKWTSFESDKFLMIRK